MDACRSDLICVFGRLEASHHCVIYSITFCGWQNKRVVRIFLCGRAGGTDFEKMSKFYPGPSSPWGASINDYLKPDDAFLRKKKKKKKGQVKWLHVEEKWPGLVEEDNTWKKFGILDRMRDNREEMELFM